MFAMEWTCTCVIMNDVANECLLIFLNKFLQKIAGNSFKEEYAKNDMN